MTAISDHVVLVVTVLTSLAALAVGVRHLCLPGRALTRAVTTVMDVLGLGVIFCVSNGVLGVLVLLVVRHVGDRPVSLHRIDDIGLYIVSLLQAIAFQAWHSANMRGLDGTPEPPGLGDGAAERRRPSSEGHDS